MPRKRPPPLDDPPAASSSEEEEESSEAEEEEEEEEEEGEVEVTQKQQSHQQKARKVEEEEDDNEEEDGGESDRNPGKKPSLQQTSIVKKSSFVMNPKSKSSSSRTEGNNGKDNGSESESGSENSPVSPGASDFTIKPIPPKTIDVVVDKPKTSSTSKPTNNKPTVAKASTKRPAESDLANGKPSKSKRSNSSSTGDGEEDDVVVAAGEKKTAINRLWSEDDEIAVLEGMLELQLKKGPDTSNDALYEFVKDTLRIDVSKAQLMDKVRRLRRKYKNNAERSENGKDPVFCKPHESKSYALSKKIWGVDGSGGANNANSKKADNAANSDATAIAIAADYNAAKSSSQSARKNSKANSGAAVAIDPPNEEALVVKRDAGKVEVKQCDEGGFTELYPFLFDSLRLHSLSNMQSNELGVKFWEKNLRLVGKSKLEELEAKWKQLKMAETELFLKRLELIKEEALLILNGIKSSEN